MIGRASQEAEIAWPLVRKPTTYTRYPKLVTIWNGPDHTTCAYGGSSYNFDVSLDW